MNPAWSVVFFTVLAGFGQGLAVCLAAAVLGGALQGSDPFLLHGLAVAAVLLLLGLGSSFLHLAQPKRAWRAVLMWRTSWLSREVIVLPALIGAIGIWWLALLAGQGGRPLAAALAVLVIALSVLLWICTAMIYASIRFIQEWAHPLTTWNYLLIGLSSGFVLACALAAIAGESRLLAGWAPAAIVVTLAAAVVRVVAFRRNASLRQRSTLQSATGIPARRLVQMSMGMSGGSFNTREFFHGLAAQAVQRIKWFALLLGFGLPLLLALWGWRDAGAWPWVLAVAVQAAGLVAERWVFFAQARHPQNLYYQRVS